MISAKYVADNFLPPEIMYFRVPNKLIAYTDMTRLPFDKVTRGFRTILTHIYDNGMKYYTRTGMNADGSKVWITSVLYEGDHYHIATIAGWRKSKKYDAITLCEIEYVD